MIGAVEPNLNDEKMFNFVEELESKNYGSWEYSCN